MKTFKEYTRMTRGYAIGGVDQAHPIASLGDVPPKGKGSRSYRAVGLTAQKNPRIARKPGQKAGSDKHSDLYTDENPKGTIHGLGFKDVATAKASVTKIRGSSRSHAHKIQAAVAMEQRAREMGKTSEAAVYRKFINTMKKKTKKMNEETIDENYGTGRARRARMGGVQPKTVGAVSNSELDAEFKKKKAKDKAKDRETASKVDVSGLSPADALMKRKAAERKAERIRIKASKMRREEVEVTGGFQFQDYDPNMKFREYEFIDIIKAESLKGAVSESSDYEKLKKKVGSKVKHDKPAMTFKEFKNINKYT